MNGAEIDALTERLRAIAATAGGTTGMSIIHVESGELIAVRGDDALPLYSVFKLPLAVVVFMEIEAGRLRLDKRVSVTADDVSPGWSGNSGRWSRTPIVVTVGQLLEHSLVHSDNTASDKLLALVGGPAAVTARMRTLGFDGSR